MRGLSLLRPIRLAQIGLTALAVVACSASLTDQGCRTYRPGPSGYPTPDWDRSLTRVGYPVVWLAAVRTTNPTKGIDRYDPVLINPFVPLAALVLALGLPAALADRRQLRWATAGACGLLAATADSLTAGYARPHEVTRLTLVFPIAVSDLARWENRWVDPAVKHRERVGLPTVTWIRDELERPFDERPATWRMWVGGSCVALWGTALGGGAGWLWGRAVGRPAVADTVATTRPPT